MRSKLERECAANTYDVRHWQVAAPWSHPTRQWAAHQVLEELEAEVLHLQRPAIRHQAASKRHYRMRLASLQLHNAPTHDSDAGWPAATYHTLLICCTTTKFCSIIHSQA